MWKQVMQPPYLRTGKLHYNVCSLVINNAYFPAFGMLFDPVYFKSYKFIELYKAFRRKSKVCPGF